MTGMITLITKTSENPKTVKIITRAAKLEDSEALARLYFASYDSPDVASQEQALEQIRSILSGTYGDFYPEASPVLVDENGRIVAAALCLHNRKDLAVPADKPTIYELFTAASRRREGLAEQLVRISIDAMNHDGVEEVTVRVEEDNYAALALYLTLDFHRWQAIDDDEF